MFQDLSQTFKGELDQMRKAIQDQDTALKNDLKVILDSTMKEKQERAQALDQVKQLREEVLQNRKAIEESKWDVTTRTLHFKRLEKEKKVSKTPEVFHT